MIVGVMIGSGIFISPASVLVNSGSAGFSLIVWGIGGVIVLSASLCYVELGTMIPKSGGDYTYIKEGFGGMPAFLFNFVYTFITRPSGAAIVVTTFGEYISEPFLGVGCTEGSKAVVVKLLAALCLGKCGWGFFCFFFLTEFSFTDTVDSQDIRRMERITFYSTLPLSPAREYSDIYLRYIFNRTTCINQTAARWYLPPYRITIWLIVDVMLIFVCLLDDLILGFSYGNWRRETGGLELALTITLFFFFFFLY